MPHYSFMYDETWLWLQNSLTCYAMLLLPSITYYVLLSSVNVNYVAIKSYLGLFVCFSTKLSFNLWFVVKWYKQGIWTGMICGTVVQTLILSIITMRCEWEKEVTPDRVTLKHIHKALSVNRRLNVYCCWNDIYRHRRLGSIY